MTLLALLAFFWMGITLDANQADIVNAISEALRNGRFEAAMQMADSALTSQPKDVRVLTLRAIAISKSGDTKRGVVAYRAALAINPDYVPALAGVAELDYKSGSDQALNDVDSLLRLRPGDETAHAMRAVIAWKRSDCGRAVDHFSAAPHVISQQPAALQDYGACLIRLKRTPEAIPVFQQLHELAPTNHAFLFSLATAQFLDNQSREALSTLEPLLSGDQADPQALQIASDIHEKLGDTPHAVALLRQAILLAPDREDLYVDFSVLSFEHKSYQVGIDVINAGLKRMPQSAKLYLARGVLRSQLGDYDHADVDFATSARLDPQVEMSANAEVLAKFQADKLDDALATVKGSLQKRPDDAFLHYLLAEILSRHGAQPGSQEHAQALAAAQKAVQLKPDFTLARDVLSRLYLESGNATAAIEQCRVVLANDPVDQVALYRLIRALKAAQGHADPEIPQLVRRLADAREKAQKQEADANRYKLVEAPDHAGPDANF